jgi:hypothetical protein
MPHAVEIEECRNAMWRDGTWRMSLVRGVNGASEVTASRLLLESTRNC